MKYQFEHIEKCDFCKVNSDKFKVLGKRLNQSQGRSPRSKIGITVTIVQCGNCGLIFSNPQPTPENLQDHYNVNPEEYWPDEYFDITVDNWNPIIKQLQQRLGSKSKGAKTLDIGAGIGMTMQSLAQNGFESYGLEPSETFYQMAIDRMNIDPARLKCASIENADYPDNEFDFISFDAVVEHLPYPSDAITKALKWLKPGGLIYIAVPSSNWLFSKMVNTFYRLSGSDYVANLSPMHQPYHLYEFSLSSFKEHAKIHNYTVEHHYYHICDTFLPKFFDPILKPLMRITNTGMEIVVWLRKN